MSSLLTAAIFEAEVVNAFGFCDAVARPSASLGCWSDEPEKE